MSVYVKTFLKRVAIPIVSTMWTQDTMHVNYTQIKLIPSWMYAGGIRYPRHHWCVGCSVLMEPGSPWPPDPNVRRPHIPTHINQGRSNISEISCEEILISVYVNYTGNLNVSMLTPDIQLNFYIDVFQCMIKSGFIGLMCSFMSKFLVCAENETKSRDVWCMRNFVQFPV